MPKIKVKCELCGAIFRRYPSQIGAHNFCGASCSRKYKSAQMRDYNLFINPMNTSEGWSAGMRAAVRDRERAAKGRCKRDTYPKYHGQHEHRAVAELLLGRPLEPGEVVHHINGDKHDNCPENLMVFSSQQEHLAYHLAHQDESGVRYHGKRVIA